MTEHRYRAVIVTGGRDFDDAAMVDRVLSRVDPAWVIEGGARGADTLAELWAVNNGRGLQTHEARWDELGKAAGHVRNREMADYLKEGQEKGHKVAVVAFPGGRGTANMVATAKKLGLEVILAEDVVREIEEAP